MEFSITRCTLLASTISGQDHFGVTSVLPEHRQNTPGSPSPKWSSQNLFANELVSIIDTCRLQAVAFINHQPQFDKIPTKYHNTIKHFSVLYICCSFYLYLTKVSFFWFVILMCISPGPIRSWPWGRTEKKLKKKGAFSFLPARDEMKKRKCNLSIYLSLINN